MKTSFRRLSISILTLLALLLSASSVTSVHAAGTVVSNTNDSGAGSLRQAIANTGAGATITFAAELSGKTINLASTLTLLKNVTIDGSALAKPITISGDTAPANGSADVRVFWVNNGVTATLKGLAVTKGKSSAIYNQGILTITKSTLTGNTGAPQGGGIYNSRTLTITDSILSGNSASEHGGGIYNNGTLTIKNSTISNNSAESNANHHGTGGGIYNDYGYDGTLTITNSKISGNSAYEGGGISSKTSMITNSTISGNSASEYGGGITGSTVTIANSTISDNSATGGGGISSSDTATITNSIISDNSASGWGGGISGYRVTVTNSTISGNSASNGGGGGIIVAMGTLTITNSIISGNSASAGSGGGIYNNSGTMTVDNSTISSNSAAYSGGGIISIGYIDYDFGTTTYAELTMTNSTLSGNSSTIVGGGIYNEISKLKITNSTLFSNSTGYRGGGIYIQDSDGIASMSNTIIAGSPTGGDCDSDQALTASSNNLMQDGSCGATLSGDPKLGPLASNGGTTKTLGLLTGSPAIDAGDDTVCAAAPVNNLDQRGVARPAGAHCDIGAYEGEITPTILTLNPVAAQDGWVLESSENSNVGGSMHSVGPGLAIGDNAAKREYRSILSFNTSSLPDTAVIVGVMLKLKKQSIVGGGDPITAFQGLLVGMSKGTIGAAALEVGDFQAPAGTLKPFGPFLPALVNGWYGMDLSNGGKAYINKLASNSGLTQIRLRFKLDDNNDSVANYLSLYSGDAVNAADRPQLVITYVP